MIANWLYKQIIWNETKENCVMRMEYALNKIPIGNHFALMEGSPSSVSANEKEGFYIQPSINEQHTARDCALIIFSAPGATGKSALASYIAYTKNALLWDLAKERIANHSLSGMLIEALGVEAFPVFTGGLNSGEAVLIIDALDEADMISGREAIETLLLDLRAIIKNSKSPAVVLCARTETAHMIRNFYEDSAHTLSFSQYEISFFEEHNAIEFIERKIEEKLSRKNERSETKARHLSVTDATRQCIRALFALIRRTLGDSEQAKSFIGYAPVLEALSVLFEMDDNTMRLLKNFESAKNSTEIFVRVMDHILTRERDKVINGFKTRCEKEFPEFRDWDQVYTADEQIIRLAYYLILRSLEYDNYPLSLPEELSREYAKGIESFLRDHPFVRVFEENGEVFTDFAGPAFRDYVLAKLMTSGDYDMFAEEYFYARDRQLRSPSQLFFDFYKYFSDGMLRGTHFPYLYDAFKSKETGVTISSVSVEQVKEMLYFNFIQRTPRLGVFSQTEFTMSKRNGPLCVTQLSNAYIDTDEKIILSAKSGDVIISGSTIRCEQLVIQSQSIMLTAAVGADTLITCSKEIDSSAYPASKFEIRTPKEDLVRISLPDIDKWFKLRPYAYDIEDESSIDFIKFANATRSILKYFRKHGKETPGRHRELIKNVIVGSSSLKQSIYCFLEDRKIIYQDNKDPLQAKLNTGALEEFGINWVDLSQNQTESMRSLFNTYTVWKKA